MVLLSEECLNGVTCIAVDLIDTLVDHGSPLYARKANGFLRSVGCNVAPAAFRKLFRERFLEYTMGNYEGDDEFLTILAADLPDVSGPEQIRPLVDLRLECSPALPDAAPFLASVSGDLMVLLATNYVAGWAPRLLERNGWSHHFDASIVSGDIRFRKPARKFFEQVMGVSGASRPSEILMVGDSYVNDVIGASAFGFRTLLVDRGGGVEAFDRGTTTTPPHETATAVVTSLAGLRLGTY